MSPIMPTLSAIASLLPTSHTELIPIFTISLIISATVFIHNLELCKRRELERDLLHLIHHCRSLGQPLLTIQNRRDEILGVRIRRLFDFEAEEDLDDEEEEKVERLVMEEEKEDDPTEEGEEEEAEEEAEDEDEEWDGLSDSHSDVTTESVSTESSFPPDTPCPLR